MEMVRVDGSAAGGSLDMWVGHRVTDLGETTSARVTLQSRVLTPKGSVVQPLTPPNPTIRDGSAHRHNCVQRAMRPAVAVATVPSRPIGPNERPAVAAAAATASPRGVKDEWLEEGTAVPLVKTVEKERIAALPMLPRRKQNTNLVPGNGSRAFRSMLKAMREVLHEEKTTRKLQNKGQHNHPRRHEQVAGVAVEDGGTLRSARACARRETEAAAAECPGYEQVRGGGVALLCSHRSPITSLPSPRGETKRSTVKQLPRMSERAGAR